MGMGLWRLDGASFVNDLTAATALKGLVLEKGSTGTVGRIRLDDAGAIVIENVTGGTPPPIDPPPPPSSGAAFYVALTGNDSTGTGTLVAPYRTVKKALTISSPGDTVWVRDIPSGPTVKFLAENLDAGCSGTLANPKIVRPYPGEQPTFVGAFKFGDSSTSKSNYVQFYGSDNIRFDAAADTIVFENSANSQHTLEIYATGVEVRGCIVDKLSSYLGSCVALGYNGGTGQYLASGCKVTRCLLRGVGLDPGLGDNDAGHDHGVYSNYTTACEITYNVIHGIDGGWGIHLYTESNAARHVDGTLIDHNTIVDTRDGGIILASDGTSTTRNTTVTYNLLVDCGNPLLTKASYGFDFYWGGPVGTGNVGYANHSFNPADGHVRPSITGWTLEAPATGDPLFISSSTSNFQLNPFSSALGKGALGAAPVDTTPPTVGARDSSRFAASAFARGRFASATSI